ncbi:MAG: hypothetical protein COS99_02050 [Candidatus Omnitrophica bacterium CG07_land_8_20_14_0_80_42_15]|uniref:Glycosyltransferase subfamily 4-like N-terminal domain-containing protein n=1 Tax=Candidatus Aquitaenariimonas noxiae TaxID=1974741 RepID=A0A2J0KUA4_9BACT|nr:MAG: hypothetical protein COS99_02050 [Candidatus Omnitrophica bacterium CG07_land_8_20_14_0_80_42_15]
MIKSAKMNQFESRKDRKQAYRICMISGAYPPLRDGIGDYTFKLLENLKKSDLDITLLTSRIEGLEQNEENFRIIPAVKRWNIFAVYMILKLIKQEQFDIIHMQYPSSRYQRTLSFAFLPLLVRIFERKTRIVITIHEFSIAYPINRLRQLLLAYFSDQVIVSDKGDFDKITKVLANGLGKTKIIPIGSNIDARAPSENNKGLFLQENGFRPDRIIVSFFGFIHPNKGVETLLKAIAELKKTGSPIILLMIAELNAHKNSYHKDIEGLIGSLGIKELIFWTGYGNAAEISKFLSVSDICILPFMDGVTFRRGTLMAALVHGLPVLSTKGIDVPPKLKHKENIYLTETGNFNDMASGVKELIADRETRNRIANNAKKLADEFSWDKIAAAHKELYLDLMKGCR